MDTAEGETLFLALNDLLEAERAGARVALLSAREDVAPELRSVIEAIHRDAAHWCGVLSNAIRELGFTPSKKTYLTVPFLLADQDVVVEEIAPRKEYEEAWRTLRVVFPERIPTHSREQFFYFDQDFLLRRFDFEAVTSAAHYCVDYASFDGLKFPTLHRIISKQRDNSLFKSSTGVLIEVADIRIAR